MKISPEELLQVFRDTIDRELDRPVPIKLPDDGDAGGMLDQGVAMLQVFWEKADVPKVIAVRRARRRWPSRSAVCSQRYSASP